MVGEAGHFRLYTGCLCKNKTTAQQIILAPNPGDALLGETSEGTWIYWIEPQDQGEKLPTAVRAELYRVDDALTNQGQRMVSDTPLLTLPDKLPEITLN